jgi:hypothetical protein
MPAGPSTEEVESQTEMTVANTDDALTKRFYHGSRAELVRGDLIEPGSSQDAFEGQTSCVYLTTNLDEAIWDAELALGEGPARVYLVEPLGEVANAAEVTGWKSPGHPSMSSCSRAPLRVISEVTEWTLYHGTRADLKPGDLIKPGYDSNYADKSRTAGYVYMTRTLDAATWGAELAAGEGPGRIYVVEPTGPVEDDPDLTNKKFRGNPTKAFRSRDPLRVTGEVTNWQGHPAEALNAMKDWLAKHGHQGDRN